MCKSWKVHYSNKMRRLRIVVEKHPDGHITYPMGHNGIVVGEGNTYEDAVADCRSALRFHIETFGVNALKKRHNQFAV